MRKSILSIVSAFCILAPSLAQAVTYCQLEAVNQYGYSTYAIPSGSSIAVTGVVICNTEDMTNTSTSGWWQVFVQSLDLDADFGGIALWDGNSYAMGGTLDPDLANLELYYGQVVTVTAYTGNSYKGKFNLTDSHNNGQLFEVSISGTTAVPQVTDIDLSDLKHADDSFNFDSSRNEGCEKYQGTLVHLMGLTLVEASAWGPGNMVAVRQIVEGTEYTFDMILGVSDTLDLSAQELQLMTTAGFDVTAILDQEDAGFTDENGFKNFTGGYRLWLTSANNGGLTIIPEPGTLALLAAAAVAALLAHARRRRK